jgi:lysophospholipase L1-like esterase
MPRIITTVKAHPKKVLAAGVALALTVGLFATTADAADTKAPLIVGLGDSYSSGGSSDTYPGTGQCWQSAGAYSLLAAKELGYRGKNYACSGAVTADMTRAFKGQAAQISLIDSDADWVVLTIGGNDIGILGNAAGGTTQQTNATNMLPKTQTAIENVLKGIKQKVPNAKVMLLSYPNYLPASGTCGGKISSQTNLAGATQLYKNLTATMKSASTATGTQFLDVAPSFIGHDACASDAWFSGSGSPVADHLNGKGYAQIAKQVSAAIKASDGKSPATTTTSTTAKPTVPATPKVLTLITAKPFALKVV